MNKKILDLGCGKLRERIRNNMENSFGVDFIKFDGVDLKWDLNKVLPKKLHNKFDLVYSKGVLDHLGNPLIFLKNSKKYLKKNGEIEIIIDNGDYWRYHFHLGNYHADIWEKDEPDFPYTHHKMLFQMKHLTKILKIIGFEIISAEYFRDHQVNWRKGHIDYLLPKYLGCNMMRIKGKLI